VRRWTSSRIAFRAATPGAIFFWWKIRPRNLVIPLNIKDRATEQSVRELAALTGETVTTAVRRAAEERLYRVRRARAAGTLAAELLAIGRRCSALPDLDPRTADEILGYDKQGLPS
jgi:antitoxin VapB